MTGALSGFGYMDLDDFEDLVLDKPEDEKWELIGGRVIRSLIGARLSHHRIIQNVNFALRSHIRARGLPCQTFTETFWLKQRFQKLAAFPDVMVHCSPMEPKAASLDDPLILIEVVSPTSGSRDRGEKTPAYMRLGSAQHICPSIGTASASTYSIVETMRGRRGSQSRTSTKSSSLPRFRSQPIHTPSLSFHLRGRWKRKKEP